MHDDPELYREILLDHGHHPRGEGRLPAPDLAGHGSNADTGDVVELTLQVADGKITAVGFTAQGSTVLRASCSLMTELIMGLSPAAARAKAIRFQELLTTGADDADWADFGEAIALRGIRQFPARVRCAVLPWRTLSGLLAESGEAEK